MTRIDKTVKDLMTLHDDAAEARHINGAPVYNSVANKARKEFEAALRAALSQSGQDAPVVAAKPKAAEPTWITA